jgi:hypothetical protein
MTVKRNLEIVRGSTFSLVVYWETLPIVYKAITGISQTAPVRITAPGHGALEGARAAVTAVRGMKEINAADPNALTDEDYHRATVVDANTVEFNDVNAADFRAYVSGGYLQYFTPVDLTGFSARISLRRRRGVDNLLECTVAGVSGDVKPGAQGVDGTVTWVSASSGTPAQEWVPGHSYDVGDVVDVEEIFRATSDNGRVVLDEVAHTITLLFSAEDTAGVAVTDSSGVFDLEMVSPDVVPVVTKILAGGFTAVDEATMN